MPWGGGARARRILCFGGTDQERERRRQKKKLMVRGEVEQKNRKEVR